MLGRNTISKKICKHAQKGSAKHRFSLLQVPSD